MNRRTITALLLGIASLVLVVAVTTVATRLVRQPIGLGSEPASAGVTLVSRPVETTADRRTSHLRARSRARRHRHGALHRLARASSARRAQATPAVRAAPAPRVVTGRVAAPAETVRVPSRPLPFRPAPSSSPSPPSSRTGRGGADSGGGSDDATSKDQSHGGDDHSAFSGDD